MASNLIEKAIEEQKSGNYQSAIEILAPLAKDGNAEAQFQLGYLYFTDAEVSREDSTNWLMLAATQDHPEAFYWLACLSRGNGWVGTPDTSEGLESVEGR